MNTNCRLQFYVLLFLVSGISHSAFSQNKSLGIGVDPPNPNAALHVESPTNNQGFIMPRLTTAQRTAMTLAGTDNGLTVYDTDLNSMITWDGAEWNSSAKLILPYAATNTTVPDLSTLFTLTSNPANSANIVDVAHFINANPAAFSNVLKVTNEGSGAAFVVSSNGDGSGGIFLTGNTTNTFPALRGQHNGLGTAVRAFTGNAANVEPSLLSLTRAIGPAADFSIDNTGNSAPVLKLETNGAGPAIQTSGRIEAGQYVGDGSGLTNLPPIGFPFAAINTNAPNGSSLFSLSTDAANIADIVNVASFVNLNAAAPSNVLKVTNMGSGSALVLDAQGTGSGGRFQITNPANNFWALTANTSGGGAAFSSSTTGTANAGTFLINNGSNDDSAIYTDTFGTGVAIHAQTATGWSAVYGSHTGSSNGFAAQFETTDPANAFQALKVISNSAGGSARFEGTNSAATNSNIASITNGAGGGILSESTGTGYAGSFRINNPSNGNSSLFSRTDGTGAAGHFEVANASSGSAALFSTTNGTGAAFQSQTASGFSAIYGVHSGASNGFGGRFEISNAANTFQAINATSMGTGGAARFETNNTSGTNSNVESVTNAPGGALRAVSTGTGYSGSFEINNSSNGQSALSAVTNGIGSAGNFNVTNSSSLASALTVSNSGTGTGINIQQTGNATALSMTTNTGNPSPALLISNNGNGSGLTISQNAAVGSFPALGVFNSSTQTGININQNGSGGTAINVSVIGAANSSPAINIAHAGNGSNAFFVNHTGTTGNLAVLQSGNANVARIDKTGQGFFNGGTVSSGADVAEAFEVEGTPSQYEPGDVLVISETTDRTVEKSASPNSRKVVGVYATKPGVLLTDRGIDDDMGNTVPMGVIGVIPTKVCLENGPIKRGDLLVSSSEAGKAMKAVPAIINGIEIYPQGAIIGKALENFDGTGKTLINVLVNVK